MIWIWYDLDFFVWYDMILTIFGISFFILVFYGMIFTIFGKVWYDRIFSFYGMVWYGMDGMIFAFLGLV